MTFRYRVETVGHLLGATLAPVHLTHCVMGLIGNECVKDIKTAVPNIKGNPSLFQFFTVVSYFPIYKGDQDHSTSWIILYAINTIFEIEKKLT